MIHLGRRDVEVQTLQGGAHCGDEGADTRTEWRARCSGVEGGSKDVGIVRSKVGRVEALDTEAGNVGVYSFHN